MTRVPRVPWALMLAVVVSVCVTPRSGAQPYPSKPIRLISPYPPGGTNDLVARMLAQHMAKTLGQPWLVENRPGRGGNIGTDLAAKALADGYTLVHSGMGALTLAPFLSKLPYDTLRDFAPITLTARAPNVIAVHPALPAKSVRELVALARSRPGQLDYATSGVGSTPHLSAALFQSATGIQMVHVPYKGSTPATVDLVAGQIPILFAPISAVLPQLASGKVRAIGVSSVQRSTLLPEVATIQESGLPSLMGFEMNPWFALLAPAGTPRDIIARLNAQSTRFLRMPETAKRFATQGADAAFSTPEALLALITADLAQWGRVIRDNAIQGE